jgi:hypothetical protein
VSKQSRKPLHRVVVEHEGALCIRRRALRQRICSAFLGEERGNCAARRARCFQARCRFQRRPRHRGRACLRACGARRTGTIQIKLGCACCLRRISRHCARRIPSRPQLGCAPLHSSRIYTRNRPLSTCSTLVQCTRVVPASCLGAVAACSES